MESPWRVVVLVLLVTSTIGYATETNGTGAADEPEQTERSRRHRIDLGVEWFDAAEGYSAIGS